MRRKRSDLLRVTSFPCRNVMWRASKSHRAKRLIITDHAPPGPMISPSQNTLAGSSTWKRVLAIGVGAGLIVTALTLPLAKQLTDRQEKPLVLLEKLYATYASKRVGEDRYMTREDFIKSMVPESAVPRSLSLDIFGELFPGPDSYISFSEFVLFDALSSTNEKALITAYRLFDSDGDGLLSKDEFRRVVAATGVGPRLVFDFDGVYWERFFGSDGKQRIAEGQLLELYRTIKEGILGQEFTRNDASGVGYITAEAFAKTLLVNTPSSKIPRSVLENLRSVASAYPEGKITFNMFYEFNSFIARLEEFEQAVNMAALATSGNISKDDFKRIARVSTGVDLAPVEVDILFHLFDDPRRHGTLHVGSFLEVLQYRKDRRLYDLQQLSVIRPTVNPIRAMLKAVESFAIGGVAGAIGATFVYPIDLVKTRMQNQRTTRGGINPPGRIVYKSSWDCAAKVWQLEGPLGFYKGLGPQLVGVAPEKAIKLVVNDYLRNWFGKVPGTKQGEIYFPLEVLAGAGAGASQVIFTNPLEIVKIRLQVQGETPGASKSAWTICRELGFAGLYKGASACFLRDIPFSGIYFPAYAKFKQQFKDEESGHLSNIDLLLAGSLAGVLAASTTTPADVIKTRLQVEARLGEAKYSGILDCFAQILRTEGPTAFFKGVVPRVFRSSPQFGITLLAYEFMQKIFHPEDIIISAPTNAPVTRTDLEEVSTAGPIALAKIPLPEAAKEVEVK
jgi:solute carrier family 25 aspartate/glutamate transporter 12/13